MLGFSKRNIKPELLDSADPAVACINLQELEILNKHFGGHSTIRKLLRAAAPRDEFFTLLDVGAASGDSGRLIREMYPRAKVTNFDRSAVNLARAPLPKVIGDAFRLPFARNSFDYVFCSLFLHHFSDEQVIELLRQFGAVARIGVWVCDLERHVLPYLFLRLSQPIFQWHWITVHDGQRSFQAALSARELRHAALAAGLQHSKVAVHRPAFRLTMIARKSVV
ncbi:MAG TPA: methyltransferase domain-containing protein [Bryobacteraceae bacterium]|jgi:hypothetical protein|nr:methyltransferase domain-containing protein [Bryobacteraceae bacterium]